MATAAERRKARKEKRKLEQQGKEIDNNEEISGPKGLTSKQRSENQYNYYATMLYKLLVRINELRHEAGKVGITFNLFNTEENEDGVDTQDLVTQFGDEIGR